MSRPMTRAVPWVALLLLAPALQGASRDGWEVVHQPAKKFTVKDVAGNVLRSDQLAGKIVVVDFWATWCAPCLEELPGLAAYQERIKGRNDVALLSMDVTDERSTLEAFVKKNRIAFPVYLGDSLLGPYEIMSFPTKLIIDMRADRGIVRFRREGLTEVASLEARVEELLRGRD